MFWVGPCAGHMAFSRSFPPPRAPVVSEVMVLGEIFFKILQPHVLCSIDVLEFSPTSLESQHTVRAPCGEDLSVQVRGPTHPSASGFEGKNCVFTSTLGLVQRHPVRGHCKGSTSSCWESLGVVVHEDDHVLKQACFQQTLYIQSVLFKFILKNRSFCSVIPQRSIKCLLTIEHALKV